ncbi:hypothetical protein GCM10023114_31120 [Mycolicibacterium sediminis]|uniref:Uncharacterized protein n=1 Tax=Mycolicibacterium sediminis TaxID=1286180 RepID=A0A7I7QY47_9MYCO|nr:hypothetical protein MSEDJ_53700 [Mycolicibacterium sediminis]
MDSGAGNAADDFEEEVVVADPSSVAPPQAIAASTETAPPIAPTLRRSNDIAMNRLT